MVFEGPYTKENWKLENGKREKVHPTHNKRKEIGYNESCMRMC